MTCNPIFLLFMCKCFFLNKSKNFSQENFWARILYEDEMPYYERRLPQEILRSDKCKLNGSNFSLHFITVNELTFCKDMRCKMLCSTKNSRRWYNTKMIRANDIPLLQLYEKHKMLQFQMKHTNENLYYKSFTCQKQCHRKFL